jgi:hypothetical protein
MKTETLLVFLTSCAVTCCCRALPVHAIASVIHHKHQVGERSANHKLFAFFDISTLEREEKERGGIWKSLEDVEAHYQREALEETPLDDENLDCNYITEKDKKDEDCNKNEKEGKQIKEHPLRTDEWLIKVTLSPFLLPGNRESELFPDLSVRTSATCNKRRKRQIIRFAKNGYVMIMEDPTDCTGEEDNGGGCGFDTMARDVFLPNSFVRRVGAWLGNHASILRHKTKYQVNDMKHSHRNQPGSNRITKIGKWKIDTNGVSWSIPVTYKVEASNGSCQKSCTVARTTLYYHADIHLSKFQDHPRMFRGVITRDHFHGFPVPGMDIRKDLFRPVIATFTAEGIGKDTVDVSYKKRGFGLKGNA